MMKDLVWLHIGMHKTGSTAIQDGLKSYDDGVTRYARLGMANHSQVLGTLFNRRPTQQEKRPGKGFGRFLAPVYLAIIRRRFLAELTGPAPRLILSGEALSHFDKPSMAVLAQVLKAHAEQVRVLVYVRDPVSYTSSAFQQRVKGGNHSMKLTSPSFRKRLRLSFEVFGRDAVEVAAFDRRAFGAGGVLADAARRIGVRPEASDAVVLNESLSAGAVGLLYFWNRVAPAASASRRAEAARRKVIDDVAKAVPGRFRLAPSLARSVVDPADLDWLLRQTGIDFRDCLTQPDAPDSDIFSEDDLRAARDAALPALIAHMTTLGIKNIPADADAAMTRLFQAKLTQTSRIAPYVRFLTKSADQSKLRTEEP